MEQPQQYDLASAETPGGPTQRRQAFARAAAATYGTNVLVAALSLVNVLIVARALGPSGRGEVAFLLTVAVVTSAVASLGVEQANANVAGVEPRARPALATNSLLLAVVLGGAAVAAVGTLIALLPAVGAESDPTARWVALGAIPVVVAGTCLGFLAQADYGYAAFNWAWLVPALIQVTVNGTLAAVDSLTVTSAVVAWSVGQALGSVLLVWYVAARLAGFGRPDAALALRSLGFGIKSHGGRVMAFANYRLDQWLVGALGGTRELGLYSVAVAWAEALFFLPTALSLVQRPDLVRSSRRDAAVSAAAVARIALAVTVVAAAALVVMAPVLCVVVFGDEFRGSVDDLRVLAFGALGIVLLKLLGNALVAQGRPLLSTAAIGVAFASIVVLDILLIPAHGGLGAAIASTVAYSAGGVAAALLFARALGGRLVDLVPRFSDGMQLWQTWRSPERRGLGWPP